MKINKIIYDNLEWNAVNLKTGIVTYVGTGLLIDEVLAEINYKRV